MAPSIMCVYISMYKCLYVYIHVCICIYLYMYVYIYVYIYIYVNMYTYIYIHTGEGCVISKWCVEWVMSHMNESCLIWMSHVSHERVMSHMNESCHTWVRHRTYEWVVLHAYLISAIGFCNSASSISFFSASTSDYVRVWHDSLTRDVTHSHETWLIHLRHYSFIRDVTSSYVTWLVHMWL